MECSLSSCFYRNFIQYMPVQVKGDAKPSIYGFHFMEILVAQATNMMVTFLPFKVFPFHNLHLLRGKLSPTHLMFHCGFRNVMMSTLHSTLCKIQYNKLASCFGEAAGCHSVLFSWPVVPIGLRSV